MQISISKQKIQDIEKFILRCSYGKIFDRQTRKSSFVKRLRGSLYPRFHIHIKETQEQYMLNLHLDQRYTRYKGATAHSGDYDGPVVEGEVERIKTALQSLA
ncbi:MAG: hypothetical protein ABIH87_01625 [bacterium]